MVSIFEVSGVEVLYSTASVDCDKIYANKATASVKLYSKQHVTFGSVLLINHLPICLLVALLVVLLLPQLLLRKSSLSPSLGLLHRQMMSASPTFVSTIAHSRVSGSIISVHRSVDENAIHLFANVVSYACGCVVVSRRLRVTVTCGESSQTRRTIYVQLTPLFKE